MDASKENRALVTGATGFIAGHLARRLHAAGWETHVIVRPSSNIGALGELLGSGRVHVHDGATENLMAIVAAARPTTLLHLASLFLAQHQSQDVTGLVRSNVEFGTQLAEAAAVHKVTHFVNTGTAWQHFEDADYNPVNLYAATKQALAGILRYYAEAGAFRVTNLELFDTYGPGDARPKLFAALRQAAASGKPLAMSGGQQLIDLVYVDDVVEAYLAAARAPGGILETYAVSSASPLRLRDLVELWQRVTGRKLKTEWGARAYRARGNGALDAREDGAGVATTRGLGGGHTTDGGLAHIGKAIRSRTLARGAKRINSEECELEEKSNQHVAKLVPAVGDRVAGGMSLLLAQMVLARGIALATQMCLARLLYPADFTLAGIATSTATILTLIQLPMGDLLIQRQRHFRRWVNSAFWLAAACSLIAMLVAFLIAPIAGLIFQSPGVAVLLAVMGLTALLNGVQGIWAAELSIQFRFRHIAALSTVNQIIANGLMVFFAWLGMGALSLVLPLTIATAVNLALYCSAARFRPTWPTRGLLSRWRLLIGDGWMLAVCGFAAAVNMQADTFCLGLYHKQTMGNYVWAYALALQFVLFLSGSLRGTLLPAFSMISGDRDRAAAAFLEAIRMVAFVAMPVCILLVPAMPAVIRYVFSARWSDAAPLVQILLPSMGFSLVCAVATTAMQSRGLYKRYLVLQGVNAAVFVAAVWTAAASSGPFAVAVTVSLIYGLAGPVYAVAASLPSSARFQLELVGAILLPATVATAAAVLAWIGAGRLVSDANDWVHGGLALITGGAVYAAGAGLRMRGRIRSLSMRVQTLWSRVAGKHGTATLGPL